MKVLEKHEAFEDWKLEVTCKDSGWRDEHVNCGSKIPQGIRQNAKSYLAVIKDK